MLRRIPLHPLLIGAVAVLRLWSLNRTEVTAGEALPVLAWTLGGVALALGLSLLVLRDAVRAGIVTTAAAVLVLWHGYLLGAVLSGPVAVVAVAGLVTAVALLVRRAEENAIEIAGATANAAALAMVVVFVPGVVSTVGQASPASAAADSDPSGDPAAEADAILDAARADPTRDIFYIVPDRYARDDALAETVDHDNSAFTDFLEDRGFEVVDEALSNYPKTAHSLASTLSLDYLDDLTTSVPPGRRDSWRTLYTMMDDHLLGHVLTGAGYEYIHVGSWWSPTSTSVLADEVRTLQSRSEFANVFLGTTAYPDVVSRAGEPDPLSIRGRNRVHGMWQLDELERLAAETSDGDRPPRFVFFHIALPHEPYVFDVDGRYVTREESRARTNAENYRRQLQYLNSRLQTAIDLLVDQPEETAPIVLLQADEGPHPRRLRQLGDDDYEWGKATDAELQEKFRILSAYRLPGVDAEQLVREDMTPVNSFRLILDAYLGTDLGQLEDRSFVFPEPDDLYTFEDVTDRLRGTP